MFHYLIKLSKGQEVPVNFFAASSTTSIDSVAEVEVKDVCADDLIDFTIVVVVVLVVVEFLVVELDLVVIVKVVAIIVVDVEVVEVSLIGCYVFILSVVVAYGSEVANEAFSTIVSLKPRSENKSGASRSSVVDFNTTTVITAPKTTKMITPKHKVILTLASHEMPILRRQNNKTDFDELKAKLALPHYGFSLEKSMD